MDNLNVLWVVVNFYGQIFISYVLQAVVNLYGQIDFRITIGV